MSKVKKHKVKQEPASASPRGRSGVILQRACEAAPAVFVGLLVLFQGGYYAGATCVIALAGMALLLVLAVVRRNACLAPTGGVLRSGRAVHLPLASILLLIIALLFLLSAVSHGSTATMLLETVSWFAVAGISLWCIPETAPARAHMIDDMAVVGAFLSAIGILMFAGIVPVEGAVNAGRLMFTFQYANTAGLFFGVIAILCMCSGRKWYCLLALLPIVALGLTQSAGALAVFFVALVAAGVRYVISEKPDRRLVAGISALIVGCCVVAVIVLKGRLAQAAQTFVERIVQMLDAIPVIANNLVLGIGPDSWQFVCPTVQTAQYRAADVHCSYLQIALDGGVLAAVTMVVLVVVGVLVGARLRDFRSCVCVLMMAAHAVFDFDFQFSASVVLLALLATSPSDLAADGNRETRLNLAVSNRMQSVACWIIAICALIACVGGIYIDMRMGEVQNVCARGRGDEAVVLLESTPFLSGDPAMRVQEVGALLTAGEYDAVVSESEGYEHEIGSIGLYRAVSLNELGKRDEAVVALSQLLEDFPYDTDLYEAVRVYGEERNLGAEFIDAYNAQATRANELAMSGHAAWLTNQKLVDPIPT